MNRFLYAEANPSSFVDPDGHCLRYIDDICGDHQNSTEQQQAAAAQHQKDVAKHDDSVETAYIKHAHAGGAATPVPVASGCLPGRGNSLACDASRSSRLGTSYDIAVDAYHDQQASRAADPGGGWASFATFYAGLLAGGTGSAVLDLFLGTASEFGTPQLLVEGATGCVAARDQCQEEAAQLANWAGGGASGTVGDGSYVWFEVSNQGGAYPGTTLPRSFDLTVSDTTFSVVQNATKHMVEYLSKHDSGSFPMSSLASAVDWAVRSGTLSQGRNFLTVGNWELGIDTLSNVIYHALYRP